MIIKFVKVVTLFIPSESFSATCTSSCLNSCPFLLPAPFTSKEPQNRESVSKTRICLKGDMIFERPKDGSVRNAINDPSMKWPKVNGVITIAYVLEDRLPATAKAAVAAAAQHYAKNTCIRWVPRTEEKHFVVFMFGEGCNAQVGYSPKKQAFSFQQVSLGKGCDDVGVAIHEMMHVIGFWHEQSRPDRDQYIQIVWENIMPNMTSQYDICTGCSTLDLPYDMGSVMHNGDDFFSKNGKLTFLVKKNPPLGPRIGTRKDLSEFDIKKINKLYQC